MIAETSTAGWRCAPRQIADAILKTKWHDSAYTSADTFDSTTLAPVPLFGDRFNNSWVSTQLEFDHRLWLRLKYSLKLYLSQYDLQILSALQMIRRIRPNITFQNALRAISRGEGDVRVFTSTERERFHDSLPNITFPRHTPNILTQSEEQFTQAGLYSRMMTNPISSSRLLNLANYNIDFTNYNIYDGHGYNYEQGDLLYTRGLLENMPIEAITIERCYDWLSYNEQRYYDVLVEPACSRFAYALSINALGGFVVDNTIIDNSHKHEAEVLLDGFTISTGNMNLGIRGCVRLAEPKLVTMYHYTSKPLLLTQNPGGSCASPTLYNAHSPSAMYLLKVSRQSRHYITFGPQYDTTDYSYTKHASIFRLIHDVPHINRESVASRDERLFELGDDIPYEEALLQQQQLVSTALPHNAMVVNEPIVVQPPQTNQDGASRNEQPTLSPMAHIPDYRDETIEESNAPVQTPTIFKHPAAVNLNAQVPVVRPSVREESTSENKSHGFMEGIAKSVASITGRSPRREPGTMTRSHTQVNLRANQTKPLQSSKVLDINDESDYVVNKTNSP